MEVEESKGDLEHSRSQNPGGWTETQEDGLFLLASNLESKGALQRTLVAFVMELNTPLDQLEYLQDRQLSHTNATGRQTKPHWCELQCGRCLKPILQISLKNLPCCPR